MSYRRRVLVTVLLFAMSLGMMGTACPIRPQGYHFFKFTSPGFHQLSLVGDVTVDLYLPKYYDTGSLIVSVVRPDDSLEVLNLDINGRWGTVDISALEEGEYRVYANLDIPMWWGDYHYDIYTKFEIADLDNPDECEVFNNAACLLPYPSSRFLDSAATTTGVQLNFPASGIPVLTGPPLDPSPQNALDGFSPMSAILAHFPAGVDLEASGLTRLLDPECCGQPVGPPWIDTRTHDEGSLDSDHPTVLIDLDTGERVLHWVELDARANGNPDRQTFIIRPGKSLTPGGHYAVAYRNLIDVNGDDIEAEPAFATLRDYRPTDIPGVDARRHDMESLFFKLWKEGIKRHDLVLAFDFVVQSDDQLTRQMLSMRDQAYDWLDDRSAELVPGDSGTQTFTIDSVVDADCNQPGTVVWRTVKGTFESPLFLDGDMIATSVQFMNVDANDVPVQNGVTNADYSIAVPCEALTRDLVNDPLFPLVLGHGIFGDGAGMVAGIPGALGAVSGTLDHIAGATDWRGLSAKEAASAPGQPFGWVAHRIIGFGTHQLNNFPGFADRLRQGVLNTLVLSRMMKDGFFNNDPTFQVGGVGVFPGDSTPAYYYGISLGGIYGTFFSTITPDLDAAAVDVPAINFNTLLQRSTQFGLFDLLLANVGLTDPMDTMVGLSLLSELWISAEPGGYATHTMSNRLPGSGSPPRILMLEAFLDKQVSNQATEIAARTLGLPNLEGSIRQGLVGIPDVVGPVDSAFISWDTGSFDILDPAHAPFIPPLANLIPSNKCDPHGARPRIPAGIDQLLAFIQPGGQAINTCGGVGALCDSGSDYERTEGKTEAELCDPLAP